MVVKDILKFLFQIFFEFQHFPHDLVLRIHLYSSEGKEGDDGFFPAEDILLDEADFPVGALDLADAHDFGGENEGLWALVDVEDNFAEGGGVGVVEGSVEEELVAGADGDGESIIED